MVYAPCWPTSTPSARSSGGDRHVRGRPARARARPLSRPCSANHPLGGQWIGTRGRDLDVGRRTLASIPGRGTCRATSCSRRRETPPRGLLALLERPRRSHGDSSPSTARELATREGLRRRACASCARRPSSTTCASAPPESPALTGGASPPRCSTVLGGSASSGSYRRDPRESGHGLRRLHLRRAVQQTRD